MDWDKAGLPLTIGIFAIGIVMYVFMGNSIIHDKKEELIAEREEVEKSTIIEYSLTDEGYISEVTIKSEDSTTIINSRDFVITFVYEEDAEYTRYDLQPYNKRLTIYSSEYPSDKYK